MRTLLVASFLFAPVLIHAQALSPAPNLQSRLVEPSILAVASPSVNRPDAPVLRVSTGVVPPTLNYTVPVVTANKISTLGFAGERKVVVALMVDEKGVPNDLKVVASSDPETNQNVLKAVSQFRFSPGTLNSVPAAVPVTLTVNIVHGAE